jgi:acetyl-CoA carboxylase biotin carboxyl carrier protein
VTDAFRSLSDDEVRQIGLIIESLERSSFDFLQLEFGDIKLTIGKGHPPPTTAGLPQTSDVPSAGTLQTAGVASAPPPSAAAAPAVPASAALDQGVKAEGSHSDGVEIVAPLLGRFYAQPEPGAPPFVSVGSEVTADATVGLIEVMKTFHAVPAGIAGIITEVCVQDAQLVEYGEVLLRVRPHKTA